MPHLPPAEDDRARRRGHSNDVTNAIPPRLDVSDPTTVTKEPVIGEVSAIPEVPAAFDKPDATPDVPDNTTPDIPDNTTSDIPDNTTPDIPDSATPPSGPIAEDERRRLSSPSLVIEIQPEPTPTSAPESDDQAVPSPSPLDAPQRSPLDTTPPAIPAASATGDVAVTSHSEGLTIVPAPPVVFAFNKASNYITPSAITYLETVRGGQAWVDMVRAYLQLEQLPVPPGVRDLFTFLNYILKSP